MVTDYEQAVSELYRASHETFVTERRRLAGELKAKGDQAGAAQLAKLGRPTLSAWAVNQLWWHARQEFDELFETAAQLRRGKNAASPAHRKLLARLGARAQQLLSEGGHSPNEATLRRIAMTLAGLAAAGSFAPDMPGALTKDRDPPGFEAFGVANSCEAQDENDAQVEGEKREREATLAAAERKREVELDAAKRKREAEVEAAERKREAEAQAKRRAQLQKLEGELRAAKAELAEREQERERIAKQLAAAERDLEGARVRVEVAQAALHEQPDQTERR